MRNNTQKNIKKYKGTEHKKTENKNTKQIAYLQRI